MLNWDANTLSLMQEENIKQPRKIISPGSHGRDAQVNPNYNRRWPGLVAGSRIWALIWCAFLAATKISVTFKTRKIHLN